MQNSKISPGVIPRNLVLGEGKVYFVLHKYTKILVLQQCKIQKNIPGVLPGPFFIILTKGPRP